MPLVKVKYSVQILNRYIDILTSSFSSLRYGPRSTLSSFISAFTLVPHTTFSATKSSIP